MNNNYEKKIKKHNNNIKKSINKYINNSFENTILTNRHNKKKDIFIDSIIIKKKHKKIKPSCLPGN